MIRQHHPTTRVFGLALAATMALLVSSCGSSSHQQPSGKITVHATETSKAQDVTNGGVAGTGQFTISGAITDKGTATDYRTVKGNTAIIRRVVVGSKGTITFVITIHLGTPSAETWTITSGTSTYKGLHGKGLETVDNFDTTPATFTLVGTVS